MKKISSYIPALMLGAMAMAGCSDNWVDPPMDVPSFPEGTKATISILDLKKAYWQDNESYGTTITRLPDGTEPVIVGTIVSDCTPGNIYKALYLQDETGAICIGIDTAAVSTAAPQGLEMAVKLTGMAIGRYSGMMQLGVLQGTGVNRISMPEFRPRMSLNFGGKMDTTVVSIPELLQASRSQEGMQQWQGKLVRINHVRIKEAGEPFTTGSTTSRYIVDDEGNSIILYNSSYADFAYDEMPFGHGDVVAILSCYRTSWQLLLNDVNGLIDFDGDGAPDPNQVTLLKENFSNTQGDFTVENISIGSLSYVWKATEKYGMTASAFANSQNNPSDSWLVSPVIDLTAHNSAKLSFSHCVNKFSADPATQVSVGVRVEGSSDWQIVSIPEFSSNADWNFVNSGDLNLGEFSGKKIQFGFHYTSTAASAGTWEIQNVVLTAIKNQ